MVMMNGKEFFFKDYLQTLIYNNGKYIFFQEFLRNIDISEIYLIQIRF